MQVKLKAIYAGPNVTGQPGDIIRVSDAEGEALIAARYAEPLDSVTETEATLPEPEANEELSEPETATLPEPEKAVMPKAKPSSAKPKGKRKSK